MAAIDNALRTDESQGWRWERVGDWLYISDGKYETWLRQADIVGVSILPPDVREDQLKRGQPIAWLLVRNLESNVGLRGGQLKAALDALGLYHTV